MGERRRRTDLEAARVEILDRILQVMQEREDRLRIRENQFPLLGQLEGLLITLDQGNPVLLFQGLNLEAQRGLRKMELLRGQREAPAIGHIIKRFQVVEVHCSPNTV